MLMSLINKNINQIVFYKMWVWNGCLILHPFAWLHDFFAYTLNPPNTFIYRTIPTQMYELSYGDQICTDYSQKMDVLN